MAKNIKSQDEGFFIAQELEDGSPGIPIGGNSEDGSIMMFEEIEPAIRVREQLQPECGPLSIFRVGIAFSGKVVI